MYWHYTFLPPYSSHTSPNPYRGHQQQQQQPEHITYAVAAPNESNAAAANLNDAMILF